MWTFILKNWKIGVGFAAGIIVAGTYHNIASWLAEQAHERELVAQREEIVSKYEKANETSGRIANEYEQQITDLNRKLSSLRVQRNRCIPVRVADTTSGNDATSPTGKSIGGNGTDSATLYEYAGRAEKYRIQLVSCQNFIKEVWEQNK